MTPENAAFLLGTVIGAAGISLIWAAAFAYFARNVLERRDSYSRDFHGDQV